MINFFCNLFLKKKFKKHSEKYFDFKQKTIIFDKTI